MHCMLTTLTHNTVNILICNYTLCLSPVLHISAGGIIPNINVSVHNKTEVNSTSATTQLVPAIITALITIALIPVIVSIFSIIMS